MNISDQERMHQFHKSVLPSDEELTQAIHGRRKLEVQLHYWLGKNKQKWGTLQLSSFQTLKQIQNWIVGKEVEKWKLSYVLAGSEVGTITSKGDIAVLG